MSEKINIPKKLIDRNGDEPTMNNQNIKIDEVLAYIERLADRGFANKAYKEYIKLIEATTGQEKIFGFEVVANMYASYAYFLFRVSEYRECFKMFKQAQQFGYSQTEIEHFLYQAFIEPNVQEFQMLYEQNMAYLQDNEILFAQQIVFFEELPYWLLPTEVSDEYYLYDKQQQQIIESITLTPQTLPILSSPEALSDFLLLEKWNLSEVLNFSNAIRQMNKKTYVVIEDQLKFYSCLQGAPVVAEHFKDIVIFDSFDKVTEYFTTNNAYLPRNVTGVTRHEEAHSCINALHDERIQKGKRKGDNVLLSICIPSFNRGKRAYDNVMHLLQSYYDEEIEIVVSNNGTQNETKEYYEKIAQLEDPRVTYFAFEENQGVSLNMCKVAELAKGHFIVYISDEDLIDLNVLDSIMSSLYQSKDTLSIMRTSSTVQNRPTVKIAEPGRDALLTYMLTSNYISGIIFNNTLLKKHQGLEYLKQHQDNAVCYYYPHMFLELLLSQYGKVQGTDTVLIVEGKAEKTDIIEVKNEKNDIEEVDVDNLQMPYYATIEGRIDQHYAFAEIFKDLEICQEEPELHREMYVRLCWKTLFLVTLSISVYYKKRGENLLSLLQQAYSIVSSKEYYLANVSNSHFHYRQALKEINNFYEYHLNQIKSL